MDKDLGVDMTNDATRTFGVNQEHKTWSLGGFIKSGSSDSYVLLGGGGHKLVSDFSMAHNHPYLPLSGGTMSNTNVVTNLNADLLDGWHRNDILRITYGPTSVISLNDVVMSGIDFTSWAYAHSANVNNQPNGNGASSAACVVSFGTSYPFQIYSDYNDTSYLYYRSYYGGNGWKAWRQFAFIDSNVASATKLKNSRTIWGQSFDGTGNVSGGMGAVSYIEMSYSTPYIDFHYGNSTTDYTSRIIEGLSGQLTVTGKLRIGLNDATSTDYAFHVVGDGYFTDNVITESDFSSRGNAIIDGYVGIGTTNPSYKLHVIGNGYFSGSLTASGHTKVNSLKTQYICIECDDSGNAAGHTSEINNYSRPLYIQYGTSNNCCICYGGGNVGIGIASPTYKLHVSGNARIDGTISCIKLSQTSDIKYKTNIKQIEYEEALKIIENLNPVTWD